MKKANKQPLRDPDLSEMSKNVDFTAAERGKYAKRFSGDMKLILLDPEVSRVFPDAKSVNKALRAVIQERKRKIA